MPIIQVHVKRNAQSSIVRIDGEAGVAELFVKISQTFNVDRNSLRVLCGTKDVRCENRNGAAMSLYDYGIGNNSTVVVVMRLRGGSYDPTLLNVLRTCEKKTIVEVQSCPSIRACPRCGILIEHETACKQMVCNNCNQRFCFICLKKADSSGHYQCGAYNYKCPVAPIQTAIPIC